MRRLVFISLLALAACERIAGDDKFHVCEGAECDAGSNEESDAGTTKCEGVDAGTAACAACIAKNCASPAEACGCDPVCLSEIACYTHQKCGTCARTKTTTSALIRCAEDACATVCTCH
jgi:hypothetical protein